MKKELFSQGFVYSLPPIFSKGMALFLIPLYTRVLSPAQYGIFDLLILVATVVNLLVSMEISQAIARFSVPEKDESESNNFFTTGMNFGVLCYLIFTTVFMVLGKDIKPFLPQEFSVSFLYEIAIIYIFLSGLFYLFSNQLRWKFRVKEYSITLIIQTITTALASLILLFQFDFGLRAMIGGLAIGMLVGLIVSLIFLRNDLSVGISGALLRPMLKYSIPLILSSSCVWLANGLDRILVTSFFSFKDLGLYSFAFKLSSVLAILLIGLQTSLAPLILRDFDDPKLKNELSSLFTIFIFAVGVFIIGLVLFLEFVIGILAPPAYHSAVELVVFLSISCALAQAYLFFPGIEYSKRTSYYIVINILVLSTNALLSFLLINFFGLSGIAIATMISNCLGCLLHYSISQRYFPIPFESFKVLMLIISVSALLTAKLWIFSQYDDITNFVFSLCAFVLYLMLFPIKSVKILVQKSENRVSAANEF